MWGERLWWGLQPLCVTQQYLLASWLPGFPPLAFPPRSPPSHRLDPFLHSQQQPRDCPTIPKLPASLSRVYMAVVRTVWLSFHLGYLSQISCFPLSLKCFSSDSDNCPAVGICPASAPPPTEGRPSPTNTPAFPASAFILPSFAWVYIFFSAG